MIEYSANLSPHCTLEKSTQFAMEVHLIRRLNTEEKSIKFTV